MVNEIGAESDLALDAYYKTDEKLKNAVWKPLPSINKRQVELLNEFFKDVMQNEKVIFMDGDQKLELRLQKGE